MDFKKLKGLTIQDIIVEENTIHDDDPTVVLHMDNGRKYRIEGGYGEDTGESAHEFRTTLTLKCINEAHTNKTVKKVRGIRVQFGNNQRKEYDTDMELVIELLNNMSMKDINVVTKGLCKRVKDNLTVLVG